MPNNTEKRDPFVVMWEAVYDAHTVDQSITLEEYKNARDAIFGWQDSERGAAVDGS